MLLKEGATVLGTTIADGNGEWTITSPVLGDGTHSITATAIDAAGNESPASAALSVTIDTAAPAAPTIIGFVDDSGTTGDGRTIDTTLHLTGTAAAGSTVAIFDGATPLGTAIADGLGAWSFDTVALTLAAHSFTAAIEDLAGNVSTSPTLAATVETRLVYDLTFLGPSFGFVIQGDAERPTMSAAASHRRATSMATASPT